MTINDAIKAMNLLDAYHHYVSKVYGKELATKVIYAYNSIDEAVKHIQDEQFNGNDIELPYHIDLLVESILNIKKEEIEPVILSDWQVLAEAD